MKIEAAGKPKYIYGMIALQIEHLNIAFKRNGVRITQIERNPLHGVYCYEKLNQKNLIDKPKMWKDENIYCTAYHSKLTFRGTGVVTVGDVRTAQRDYLQEHGQHHKRHENCSSYCERTTLKPLLLRHLSYIEQKQKAEEKWITFFYIKNFSRFVFRKNQWKRKGYIWKNGIKQRWTFTSTERKTHSLCSASTRQCWTGVKPCPSWLGKPPLLMQVNQMMSHNGFITDVKRVVT